MEYTLDQLKTLISSVAGYVVIYEVMDGVCRPVLYTENVPAFSGLTEEEYISLYEKDAAAVVAPADMPVVADKLVRLVSGAGDQEALYRTYHKTRGFVWTHGRQHCRIQQAGTGHDFQHRLYFRLHNRC
jgi:hypothetical protein